MRKESRVKGIAKATIDEATKWVGGLDRINRARGIVLCHDFSATPFVPSGRRTSEESLFGWIVSDFGLNDAIESGLVKTPRVVIRDDALPDAKSYRSRLYHIYNDRTVKDDLNRKALPDEALPDLVINGYYLLGYDWRETAASWKSGGADAPPVMITVANRTETAARVKHSFDDHRIGIDELCDPARTLHIDSKVLETAEAATGPVAELSDRRNFASEEDGPEGKLTKKEQAELLRLQVDTVGQRGKQGGHIQNVISVGMLSEGWDAKNVTHIMGLRAFTSQLPCEQVVGRGLRRTSYDVDPKSGLFEAEYVNIFGVPFTFLPHEGGEGKPPPPPVPKTAIEPVAGKESYAISWPNVIRIDREMRPRLSLDWKVVEPLEIDATQIASRAKLMPIIDGKPDETRIDEINLKNLARKMRTQRIVFETARDMYSEMETNWKGGRPSLLGQLVRLVEEFIRWEGLTIKPALFNRDGLRRRLVLALSMTRLFWHIRDAIQFENAESLELIFDRDHPILSTGDMRTWFTGKPCGPARRSHINFSVHDSGWEAEAAFALDQMPGIAAWVKNDHLGFEVYYVDRGTVCKYRPDYLVRFTSGDLLVLEIKGQEDEQDKSKRRYLSEWVQAVNLHGGFGHWRCDVSRSPSETRDILAKHSRQSEA